MWETTHNVAIIAVMRGELMAIALLLDPQEYIYYRLIIHLGDVVVVSCSDSNSGNFFNGHGVWRNYACC